MVLQEPTSISPTWNLQLDKEKSSSVPHMLATRPARNFRNVFLSKPFRTSDIFAYLAKAKGENNLVFYNRAKIDKIDQRKKIKIGDGKFEGGLNGGIFNVLQQCLHSVIPKYFRQKQKVRH